MKLKINDKYEEVGILSFLKCWLISWGLFVGIMIFIVMGVSFIYG